MDKQKVLQWIDEVLKTDGWIAEKKDHYDTIWLEKFRDEMASGRFDLQVMPNFIGEWEETMRIHIEDALDHQEQQITEHYYKGREDAANYAIEMMHKHLKLK